MILSELTNWQENRTASLEHANDCIYLYSYPHQQGEALKSLWIANTGERETAEDSIAADMNDGNQPYMPLRYCNASGVIADYAAKGSWRLQWGLDQNSIAVYFRDELIAIMPEWSGYKGFYGYSAGAGTETPLAWPLLPENEEIRRFGREAEFLESWDDDSWPRFQSRVLSAYDRFSAGSRRYFAADGGKWPPLGISYSRENDMHFWATVGMSLLPMPVFGMDDDDAESHRRIELAILVETPQDTMPFGAYLSGQARYPWHYGTHLGHGHTIPCRQLREMGSDMAYMLIAETANFLPGPNDNIFGREDSRLLFMIPIHESEKAFAAANTSAELLKKIEDAGVNALRLDRKAVV